MDPEPTLSSSSDPEETMNTLLTLNQPWTTLNSSSDPETTLNPHLTLNYEVCFWDRNTCTDFESCFPAPTFSFISHFFLLVQLVVKKWEKWPKTAKIWAIETKNRALVFTLVTFTPHRHQSTQYLYSTGTYIRQVRIIFDTAGVL